MFYLQLLPWLIIWLILYLAIKTLAKNNFEIYREYDENGNLIKIARLGITKKNYETPKQYKNSNIRSPRKWKNNVIS